MSFTSISAPSIKKEMTLSIKRSEIVRLFDKTVCNKAELMILSEFRPLADPSVKNGRLSFNTSRSACLTVSVLSFENLLKMETIISMLELSFGSLYACLNCSTFSLGIVSYFHLFRFYSSKNIRKDVIGSLRMS